MVQCALMLLVSALSSATVVSAADAETKVIKGRAFESVLPPAPNVKAVTVASFRLDVLPITNAEFAAFVARQPQWRRDRVARLFADDQYLAHWKSATVPGSDIEHKPVVKLSWFAAEAYCEERGMRLPRWHEWELAAAASERAADARGDEAWRQ
jgi:formylglycine-generating enzyme required for sulfatase activity